jgi:hypothetical protein
MWSEVGQMVKRPSMSSVEQSSGSVTVAMNGIVEDAAGASVPGRARPLTERDAIEIWIARWLRLKRKEILKQYPGDPSRLYAIWWGERFPHSRAKARVEFEKRYPWARDRTDFGYRRIPRVVAVRPGHQGRLFD